MKTLLRDVLRACKALFAILVVLLLTGVLQTPSNAAGVVNNPTEAELDAALSGGGTVTFNCDGVIVVWSTKLIEADTVLDGAGHQITISGDNQVRIFNINENVHLSLRNLKLANGTAHGEYPIPEGGVYTVGIGAGGAIFNKGVVTLNNCNFEGNRAVGIDYYLGGAQPSMPASGDGTGGAIYNQGTMTATNCTFVSNQAIGIVGANGMYGYPNDGSDGDLGRPGGSGYGGALYNDGTLALINCTLTANSALGNNGGNGGPGADKNDVWQYGTGGDGGDGGNGGNGLGAAVFNYYGNVQITNCTLADNHTQAGNGGNGGNGGRGSIFDGVGGAGGNGGTGGNGGNGTTGGAIGLGGSGLYPGPDGSAGADGTPGYNHVYNASGQVVTVNTIFGLSSSGYNCASVQDGGNNLSADGSCGFGSTGLNNTDPQLSPLASNGGFTQTMALAPTSPAIGRGNGSAAPSTDQRGQARFGISDIGAYEFQGTRHSVSGRISNSSGAAVPNVRVTLSPAPPGVTSSLLTNSAGYFTFRSIPTGNYTLTPVLNTYKFTPNLRTINVSTSDVGAQNFVGNPVFTISGRIANSAGTGIAGVSVVRSGSATPVITDASGNYQFADVIMGSYTITPAKVGSSFIPASRTVSQSTPVADFTALFTISGRVRSSSGTGISGVSVALSPAPAGATSPVTTDANGDYVIRNVPSGSYYVTPTRSGYSFTPASQGLGITTAPRAANFVGTVVYRISGRISTSSGVAIPNVSVLRSGSSNPVLTNSAGYYTFTGVPSGSFTITPNKSGYSFTPSAKTVVVGTADAAGNNFIGSG